MGENVENYFIINAYNFGQPVTAVNCEVVKQAYGLTMPVLYDPLNTINEPPFNLPVNHYHIVFDGGMVTTYKGKGDSIVASEIEAVLGN